MFKAYKRYFDFQGRSNRSEYWLFALFWAVLSIPYCYVVFSDPMGYMADPVSMTIVGLYMLAALASFIPSLAVSVRRLHDTDRTGWLLLLWLIPLLGSLILLVFFVLPGTRGPNKYGPDPLAKPDAEVFA